MSARCPWRFHGADVYMVGGQRGVPTIVEEKEQASGKRRTQEGLLLRRWSRDLRGPYIMAWVPRPSTGRDTPMEVEHGREST